MLIRRLFVARLFVAVLASVFAHAAWAQAPSALAPSAKLPAAAAAKKSSGKAKSAAKPAAAAMDSGPCDMGVITATRDLFTVQKIGITVFNNEFAEMPVNWGLDDLIYARAKAAGGAGVRRIPFNKDAFDALEKPKLFFLREESEKLPAIVRKIAGSAGCRRYLVISRKVAQVPGRNQNVTGFGVLQIVSLVNQTFVFAYLDMQLFDGETFETLRNPNVNVQRVLAGMAESWTKMPGTHQIDKAMYPEVASDAPNNTFLRDELRRVLTEQLDRDMPAYFRTEGQ
jgi:hypothetical protein